MRIVLVIITSGGRGMHQILPDEESMILGCIFLRDIIIDNQNFRRKHRPASS